VFAGAHENGEVQIQCEMVGGEIGLQVLGVPTAKQCRSGYMCLACSKIIKLNQFNTLHMMQCEICFLVF
jgi:hypothetical protein